MNTAGYGKADLHVHTYFSFDGLSSPEEVVAAAIQKGLSVLAITDHNTMRGVPPTIEAAQGKPIEIVPGEEIQTGEGEIIGLFLKKEIKSYQGLEATLAEIRAQGGLSIVPHPFLWTTLKARMTPRRLKRVYEEIDAIEVFNPSLAGRQGQIVKKFRFSDLLDGKAHCGGSDSHYAKYIASAYTVFPGSTAADFRRAVAERTTKAEGAYWTTRQHVVQVGKNIEKYGKRIVRGSVRTIRSGGRRTKDRLKSYLTIEFREP